MDFTQGHVGRRLPDIRGSQLDTRKSGIIYQRLHSVRMPRRSIKAVSGIGLKGSVELFAPLRPAGYYVRPGLLVGTSGGDAQESSKCFFLFPNAPSPLIFRLSLADFRESVALGKQSSSGMKGLSVRRA